MKKNAIGALPVIILVLLQLSLLPNCTVKRGGVDIGSPGPPPPPKKCGPPPWAPAHGRRAKYGYRYYPSHYVYYDVERRVYFYIEGNGWQVSARLPSRIHLAAANYVYVELDTDKPYKYFAEHRTKYPPGQLKKNKKPKKK